MTGKFTEVLFDSAMAACNAMENFRGELENSERATFYSFAHLEGSAVFAHGNMPNDMKEAFLAFCEDQPGRVKGEKSETKT